MRFLSLAFIGSSMRTPLTSKLMSVVNFDVGGNKYSICSEDLKKHPGSMLEKYVDQKQAPDTDVLIERDGSLFKFINAFLVNAQLPRDSQGFLTLDESVLKLLKSEADFYGLPALKAECDKQTDESLVSSLLGYMKLSDVVEGIEQVQLEHPLVIKTQSPVITALRAAVLDDETENDNECDDTQETRSDDSEDGCDDNIWYRPWSYRPSQASKCTVISTAKGRAVLSAVNNAMQEEESIVIGLKHVYPARKSHPEALMGSDRALFELLQDQYELKVTSTVVYRRDVWDRWNDYTDRSGALKGALFTPEIVAEQIQSGRRQGRGNGPNKSELKLYLPHQLCDEHLMRYREGCENALTDEEVVYLVSGLQLRKKQAVASN